MDAQSLRISRIRKMFGVSRKTFAIASGLTEQAIASYEAGDRIPNTSSMLVFSTGYGFSMDWLCGFDSAPYTEKSISYAMERYMEDTGQKLPLRTDIPYSAEAMANLLSMSRIMDVLSPSSDTYKTMEKNFQQIYMTGKPVYRIHDIVSLKEDELSLLDKMRHEVKKGKRLVRVHSKRELKTNNMKIE